MNEADIKYYTDNYYTLKCYHCKEIICLFDGFIDEIEDITCMSCAEEKRKEKHE